MNPERTAFEKLFVAAIAAAVAFALAGGGLLATGPFAGMEYLALSAAVPAGVLALLPFRGRLLFLALGSLLVVAGFAMDLRGAHNPMIVIPFFGLCIVGAAAVAELCVRAFHHVRGRGTE